METIDLRRVTEIHFHRSMLQLCVNRGTVRLEHPPAASSRPLTMPLPGGRNPKTGQVGGLP